MVFYRDYSQLVDVLTVIVPGLMAALLGGAAGGALTGGRTLGPKLAASVGMILGPFAALPGIVLGLIILSFMS